MSLYRRKDSPYWWVRIQIPGTEAVQESTRTIDRVAAQEYHDQLTAQLWRQAKLGDRPTYRWEDAVVRFLDETSHKRDHEGDKQRLKWLHPHLEGRPLESITRNLLDSIMAKRKDLKPASINRYLATVRTILRKAEREWDWLEKAPAIRLRPEPEGRIRWITQEEAAQLLAVLPEHLAAATEFAFLTGLRQANIFALTWKQVDLDRRTCWIYADQAKGKKDIVIPLNEAAIEVIKSQVGKCATHVFSYAGKPMKRPDIETWRRACKKAGISDFRFHDTRHSFSSWHAQRGTPLHVIMELGGWNSMKMVLRYSHLANSHLAEYAENSALKREGDDDSCRIIQWPVRKDRS
jgi:integrase